MALSLGELVGYIDLEDKGFASGLNTAGKSLTRLQSTASSSMASLESTVSRALSQIEADIADGLDPAKAIADLDRLEAELDASLRSMLDEADQFADELDRAIDEAFNDLPDKARRSGEDAGRGFTDGVGDGGESRLPGIGNNLMSTLKGLGWAAAGAAIGAALMAGLESAMDAEGAKAKLFAQLGTTGPESERIGRVAGQLYAQAYGESMSDVTDAIRSVIQNMDGMRDASEESLTDISKRAMDVATVLDEDVGAVTRAVSQMLRTDMASSAEEAFDILVRGAQEGANKSGDLLDTFNEYSTQFRSLGLTGTQALGLIQQALQAGARDSDVAADAIKEFAIEAVAGGDRIKQGFKSIGLDADEMVSKFAKGGPTAAKAFDQVLDRLRSIKDPVERNAAAVELFGTKAEDLAGALYAMDLSTAEDAIGKVGGAARQAGDTLRDTAAHRLEAFKRSLQTNVVEFLGGTVIPALSGLADKFDLSGIGEKIGPVVEQVKTLFGGLVNSVQKWISDNQDTIQGWADKIQGAFESMSSVVGSVVDIITALWETFGDDILNILGTLVDTLLSVWNGLWKAVEGVFDVFAGIFTGDWQRVWDGVKNIFSGVWDAVKSILSGALDIVKTQISSAWDKAKELTSTAWNALKDAVSTAIDNVVDFMRKLPGRILSALGNLGKLLLQAGKDLITGLWNGVQSMAGWLKQKIGDFFGNLLPGWAKEMLGISSPSKVFAELGQWTIQGFIQGIQGEQGKAKTTVDNLVRLVKDAFKVVPDAPDALVEWVAKSNDRLTEIAKKREEIIEQIANAKKYAQEIENQMRDFASVADLGLGEGAGAGDIVAGLNDKLQAIKQFANDIKTLAERGLNKTTLRQIIEAGPEKGASLAEMLVGADGSEIKAINKAQKQIDKVSKQMGKNSADALYDVGKKAGEGFLKGLQGQLKQLEGMMAKIAKAVVDAAKKQLGVKSPSRVFADIGDNTMLGYIRGVLGRQDDTVAAVAGVVGQAAQAAARMPGLVPMTGPSPAPAYTGAEYGAGHGQVVGVGGSGVVVNMPNAVIREEADIGRLGAEFAFQYRSRG